MENSRILQKLMSTDQLKDIVTVPGEVDYGCDQQCIASNFATYACYAFENTNVLGHSKST